MFDTVCDFYCISVFYIFKHIHKCSTKMFFLNSSMEMCRECIYFFFCRNEITRCAPVNHCCWGRELCNIVNKMPFILNAALVMVFHSKTAREFLWGLRVAVARGWQSKSLLTWKIFGIQRQLDPLHQPSNFVPPFTGASGRADNLYTTVLLLVLLNYSEVVKKNIKNMKKKTRLSNLETAATNHLSIFICMIQVVTASIATTTKT